MMLTCSFELMRVDAIAGSSQKFAYTIRGVPPVDFRILVRGTRYSAITAATILMSC